MIVKQSDLRSNLKKYFDIAVNNEPVLVPRKENQNVVIISEEQYREMSQMSRLLAYSQELSGQMSGNRTGEIGAMSNPTQIPAIKSYTDTTDIRTDNLDRLMVIGDFKDNWNGNGAAAFDKDLINKVTKIVGELDIQPEIFPSAAGTIEFEYGNSRKDFMGIEVGSSGEAEVFIVMYNGREIFERIETTASAINERVRRFYE